MNAAGEGNGRPHGDRLVRQSPVQVHGRDDEGDLRGEQPDQDGLQDRDRWHTATLAQVPTVPGPHEPRIGPAGQWRVRKRLSEDPTSTTWGSSVKSCSVFSSYMQRRVVDSITSSIRSCRTASGARPGDARLQLIRGERHEANGDHVTWVVQALGVEDPCRHAESLIRLPGEDKVLEGPPLLQAPDEHAHDHGSPLLRRGMSPGDGAPRPVRFSLWSARSPQRAWAGASALWP